MNLLLSLLLVSNLQVAPGRTAMVTRLDESGPHWQLLTAGVVFDDTVINLEGTWGMAVSAGNFDLDPAPEYVCRLSDVGQQSTFITRLVVFDDDLRRLWAQTWGYMGNPETGTPAVADLDGDGQDEIIVPMVETFFPDPPEYKCRIYALDGASGQTKPGWPFICPGWPDNPYNDVFGEVVVADINDDDELEVVFITTDFNSARKGGPSCYALSATGDSLWRTEFYPGDTVNQHGCWTSPAVADLDGDGRLEIVCHVNLHGRNNPWPLLERRLFIMNSDGTIRRQWQTQGAISSQSTDYAAPVVADVNNDGAQEIVIVRRTGFL
ncbi:VCBS repeat-containing protein, partial [candidate division WOR-3 bacterium]|nr:VCBS repeat-containing protein [candidate division WOR-3 bacterium]